MSKQKSIFVTTIIFSMLAIVTFACHKLAFPVFTVIVGAFAFFGLIASAVAFCKWLELPPKENTVETFEPIEIAQSEESYNFSDIIDEVRRDA